MANFKPYSDEEIEKIDKEGALFLPDDRYPFEIVKTSEGTSGKGNKQFVLELKFPGLKWNVKAYLLPEHEHGLQIKYFKSACKAVNILNKYETGSVEHDDFLRRKGEAFLIFEEKDGKKYGKVTEFFEYVPELDANGNPIEEIPF